MDEFTCASSAINARTPLASPLERWPSLSEALSIDLHIKRDDLLPFPLPGNKVRKILAESRAKAWQSGDVVITNGGVDSNHCRTLAFLAAKSKFHAHLVCHAPGGHGSSSNLTLIRELGATYDIVKADEIGWSVAKREREYLHQGRRVHVLQGGGHTQAAVEAFSQAATPLLREGGYAWVIVPTGTGATQAGIALSAYAMGLDTKVLGISVARHNPRAMSGVAECLAWFGAEACLPAVDDRFTDGGYGLVRDRTRAAVSLGWSHGLPLDGTYTGKAFRGLMQLVAEGRVEKGSKVLFWHTGGFMNHLSELSPTTFDAVV